MPVYRKCTKSKLFFIFWFVLIFSFVIYNEVIVYHTNVSNWHKLKCESKRECTTFLIVSDPQIIGDYKDPKNLRPFSIYDSDRYLQKTYSLAFDFVKPDFVVFLGDLMDEGFVATDREFHKYVRRVFNIFLDHTSDNVRHIWLPGDNDIGGEDFDVRPRKQQRFDRAFSQPDIITHKNLTLFKINRMTLSIPVYKKPREFYDTSKIFIGLSHLPLMFMPSPFVEKVISKMLPQVLFTGHEHKSMIVSTDALLREDYHIIPVTPDNNRVFEYTLGVTDMYEIIIPTSSYRMGTEKVGYGYAQIEKNQLRFTVLWSPSRFKQLYNYLLVFIFFLISTLCVTGFYFCRRI